MGNQGKINILLIEDEDFDVRRVKNTIKFSKEKISIKHVVSNGNSAIDLLKNNLGKTFRRFSHRVHVTE